MACYGLVLLVFASFISLSYERAVNISNTWMLPEEGFPVFYRYFRDRISWYEADAVCQFHHANLVTADSTSQYDAIRAYLKEMDITDNIWIGLSKTSEKPNFTWTNFRPLNGDGHWQEVIPVANDPLCVAMDPAADFLWKPLPCGGPQVASFICELTIPPWALGPRGCLLTELPSLTVLYIPEQSALELTSDCGLDGTKRIACKGNADREDILKQLTCVISHEDFDDKSTKAPTASSTAYETSSDESSSNGKTTKTWIWTSNTIDIDYGMPTRHRRETEDTLSPISTKSTAGVSNKYSYRNKLSTTSSFTTSATNYDTEVTTVSLDNHPTSDSNLSGKFTRRDGIRGALTTQDINTRPEEPAEAFSTLAAATTETKITADDPAADYPSAINQGQLFSIIENGTMFDIIELNETEAKTAPEASSTTTESYLSSKSSITTVKNNVATVKNNGSNHTITNDKIPKKVDKLSKKDIYKKSDTKKPNFKIYKKNIYDELKDNKVEEDLTKETEMFPILKDSSVKLNRTFRKELPVFDNGNTIILESSNNFGILNSNNVSKKKVLRNEDLELNIGGEDESNSTDSYFIRTSEIKNIRDKLEPNVHSSLGNVETLKGQNVGISVDPTNMIDPKIDILNMNLTTNNDSETIENIEMEKNKDMSTSSLLVMKKQFLPKSLLGEIDNSNEGTNFDESKPRHVALENQPEEQPRPNRQRQLTRPQRRSFYPYFFSRVLG